jgi:hypothetical protein
VRKEKWMANELDRSGKKTTDGQKEKKKEVKTKQGVKEKKMV